MAAMMLAAGIIGQSGWSAAGGAETFALRDVSRTGPPADASPVSWRGSGPSIAITHERASARRIQRFTIEFAQARSFRYAGPLQATAAPASDRASRTEVRYEYRQYPFRNAFIRGFDAGVGIQGIGRLLTLVRLPLDEPQQRDTDGAAGAACVAAARLHRWTRWSAEVTWVNGVALAHERAQRAGVPPTDARLWGGGWLTDLTVGGSWRVTSRAFLSASYLRTGEGTVFTHHMYAFGRRRVVVGITYAR
jgi:hypothetical protein